MSYAAIKAALAETAERDDRPDGWPQELWVRVIDAARSRHGHSLALVDEADLGNAQLWRCARCGAEAVCIPGFLSVTRHADRRLTRTCVGRAPSLPPGVESDNTIGPV